MSDADPPSAARAPGPAPCGRWDLLALALATALLAPVFLGGGFREPDSWYHLRYADLLGRGELPAGRFPWASASTWAESFADKEWLFHRGLAALLRLVPDPLRAGQMASFLGAVALLAALALGLQRRGAPRPGAWTLLALVGSATFFQRACLLRPHVLAVALFLLLVLALLERRRLAAGALAALLPLAHAALHMPLVALGCVALGLRVRGERLGWPSAAATVGGLAAGLLLHPDFPRTLSLAWDQNARVLAHAWGGTPLGRALAAEFQPPLLAEVLLAALPLGLALAGALLGLLLLDPARTPRAIRLAAGLLGGLAIVGLALGALPAPEGLFWLSPLWVGLLAMGVRSVRRARGLRGDTAALLLLAAGAAAGSALSARFFEYLAPLGVFAAALVVRDLRDEPAARARWGDVWPAGWRRARLALAALLAGAALLGAAGDVAAGWRFVAGAGPSPYRGACAWLDAHARPDEVVFHAAWGAFPELFYGAPRQRYLVALDPTFLYYADPDHRRWALWEELRRGRCDPARAQELGCRLLVTEPERFVGLAARLDEAARAGRAARRDAADGVEVWELLPGPR